MFEELSLHIMDIAMNSLAAGARALRIAIREDARRDLMAIRVSDDGRGMDPATLKKVLGRNFTSKGARRKPIGLGLALLRQTAEMCGGSFRIRSAPGKGTSIEASMRLSHVDRPPVGDLNATILALCAANPEVDVRLDYRANGQKYQFSSRERNERKTMAYEPRRTQKT